MAIELIPGVNSENAGSYAGLLASAFMCGRSLSSIGWGKVADTYGRVLVLHVSLGLSALFSLLFGWTRNFALALFWRFLMGLSNGLILVTKTAVSELAGGDKKLEQNTMNLVMSMWGGAFLFAPALSGFVAEPVRQYTGVEWLQHGWWSEFLQTFPFFGPNVVGTVLCLMSILFVHLSVPETLPENKRRHAKHIPNDVVTSVHGVYQKMLPAVPENEEESTPVLSVPSNSYGSTGGNRTDDSDASDDDMELPPEILLFLKDDVDDAIREAQLFSDEAASAINTKRARSSVVSGLTKRSSVAAERRRSRMSSASSVHHQPTIAALWSNTNVRRHLVVYWISSFVSVAQDEGFPLFCLSLDAGLGLSENGIGSILSASGFVFLAIQLLFYAPLVDRIGLYGSMRLATVALPPLAALIPLALWFNRDAIPGQITWGAFAYLVANLALARAFGLTYFSGITVATNRLVPPSQRATLNGFGGLGASVAKSLGPAFAGLLVAFSFSSGWFTPHVGAWFLFATIGAVNVVTTVAAFCLLREDPDEEEDNVQVT